MPKQDFSRIARSIDKMTCIQEMMLSTQITCLRIDTPVKPNVLGSGIVSPSHLLNSPAARIISFTLFAFLGYASLLTTGQIYIVEHRAPTILHQVNRLGYLGEAVGAFVHLCPVS